MSQGEVSVMCNTGSSRHDKWPGRCPAKSGPKILCAPRPGAADGSTGAPAPGGWPSAAAPTPACPKSDPPAIPSTPLDPCRRPSCGSDPLARDFAVRGRSPLLRSEQGQARGSRSGSDQRNRYAHPRSTSPHLSTWSAELCESGTNRHDGRLSRTALWLKRIYCIAGIGSAPLPRPLRLRASELHRPQHPACAPVSCHTYSSRATTPRRPQPPPAPRIGTLTADSPRTPPQRWPTK